MFFYKSIVSDPYFNIACEEYFLKNFDEDFFYLYVNDRSIIVGKHQNTIAEINVPYVVDNNIKVVRRLSGGGAVFHDAGNLNYCFIKKGVQGHLVDFKKYSQPVLDTLQNLGVDAQLRGKSDLVINNLKFSGNAEHVFKNKVLHHGTMLFNSDLLNLNEAIKVDWNKFNDRAIRSNRSKVTNIINHLPKPLSIEEFTQEIESTVLSDVENSRQYFLTSKDEDAINKLIKEKYSTWEWNFAYSPKYSFSQNYNTHNGMLKVELEVEKGNIVGAVFLLENTLLGQELNDLLIGLPHDYFKIKEVANTFFKKDSQMPISLSDFLGVLF